jgi:hypothetical protein
MKGAGVASKLIMNATGATDGETKVDALMNSVPM